MIVFKSIKYKNFLSSGNSFVQINLNEQSHSLVIGKNGSGKSSFLDALTFSLFGKPFRKINKTNLVNSINKKDCVTEIEFSVNGKKYKIIRGMKPNIFEIHQNGKLLNQDSSTRDYQDYLETHILKMNYKSFTQIVILGSASFTPFMKLSASDRRTIVEDLLDIQVFSNMNIVTKQRLQVNKDALLQVNTVLSSKKDKKNFIEKNIENLKRLNQDKNDALKKKYDESNNKIQEYKEEIQKLEQEKSRIVLKDLDKLRKKHFKVIELISQMKTNREKKLEQISFYTENCSCPTCKQTLQVDFKDNLMNELNQEIIQLDDAIEKLWKKREECFIDITQAEKNIKKFSDIGNEISMINSRIKSIIESMSELVNSVVLDDRDTMLNENFKELKVVNSEIDENEKLKENLLEERQYIDIALNLLKDGGIKSRIIKQYLPIINKSINTYLAKMNFFANFNMDENFQETIKSRHRDDFSYDNFSEGEKTRIDLSILLTWRQIAKMRNSCSTNLLIMDEVFDGSLDTNGIDELLKIMWNIISDTNVIIISHKQDQMLEKFKRVYRFEKRKNFSHLTIT